jgi:hypothetical protein
MTNTWGAMMPQTYLEQQRNIVKGSTNRIDDLLSGNRASLETYGIGILYGSNSEFAGEITPRGEKRSGKSERKQKIEAELTKKFGRSKASQIIQQMKETNCSAFLLDILREGFRCAELSTDWAIIENSLFRRICGKPGDSTVSRPSIGRCDMPT